MPRQFVHRGRKIQVAVETDVSPGGQTVQRDVVIHPGAVAILPLVDHERVCLLRNHRPIVGATLWEIPAGTLEPGEVPDDAAVRELAEETGYSAKSWRKLTDFYPSPGVLSEITHVYMATDLTPGAMRLEAGEEIEPQTVAWSQALAWALDGTIRDAKTLIALLLWDRLRTPGRIA
jgi:ADP-ribose pyrophosphatase